MTYKDIELVIKSRPVIIYGAHLIAKGLYGILQRMGMAERITAFAVTDMRANPQDISGISVFPITELTEYRNRCTVLIALPEKFFAEVIQTLDELGFPDYETFGLADCIRLLNKDTISYFDELNAGISVAENPYDYVHLDVFPGKRPKEAGTNRVAETTHYKLAVLTGFPFDDESNRFLQEMDFYESYENVCGPYRNLKQLQSCDSVNYDQHLRIYMASSHKDGALPDTFTIPSWTIPVQGGAALTELRSGAVCDNNGEGISERNADYAEMSVMYWAWKNAPHSEYRGLCHYRRHFVLDESDIAAMAENDIDAVLTPARLVFPCVRNWFLEISAFTKYDYELLLDVVSQRAPDYMDDTKRFFDGCFLYPNNMVILKTGVFNSYCAWIFDILFEMERRVSKTGITRGDRYLAYSAELLTSIYFMHHRKELKIAVTDYRFLG